MRRDITVVAHWASLGTDRTVTIKRSHYVFNIFITATAKKPQGSSVGIIVGALIAVIVIVVIIMFLRR